MFINVIRYHSRQLPSANILSELKQAVSLYESTSPISHPQNCYQWPQVFCVRQHHQYRRQDKQDTCTQAFIMKEKALV